MLHGTRIASDESAFDVAHPPKTAVAEPGKDGLITVPDAHLLFNGDFQRHGSDLKIVGDAGQSFLIPGYFQGEKNPTLLSPEGASLSGDIVEALAGPLAPGQYAQAGQQTSDQPAIGRVEQVAGNATIVRNGVAITANQGDVVRKGDVVQTGGDGMIAVLFSDGSTFSLSANARMVLNDFVYQAGGSNNSALISLVQGTIGFVAGQVAKSGDMRVESPVATMGIRGTAVLVEISANDGQTKFSVMMEPDGTTGSFNLYNKTTGALIGTVNNSTVGWVVSPAGPLQVLAQQVQKTPGELQQELNYFQQIFNIFNQGQQNPFDPDQHTTNPQSTKTAGSSQFLVFDSDNSSGNGGNGSIVTVTVTGNGGNGNNSNLDLLNDPEFVNFPPIALPDGGNPVVFPVTPDTNLVIEEGVNPGDNAFAGKPQAIGNVLGNDSDPNPGDVITLTSISAVSTQLHGDLSINSSGAYIYTLDNAKLITQQLAQGETATDVFQYTITDGFGATATARLTIVIHGTNDAPVILGEPVAVELTEIADQTGESETLLTDEGSIAFEDVDISDNLHAVSFSVAATEVTTGLALDNAALLELFSASLVQTGVDGTDGTIEWDFSAPDNAFDYLAADEAVTLTYTLTLTDDFGATDTQTVTIVVTGTNDEPLILSEPATVQFTEAEGQTLALVDYNDSVESVEDFQPAYQASGSLTFEDVDVSENDHEVSVALDVSGDTAGLSLTEQELLDLLTTTVNQTGDDGTQGSIDWDFFAPDDAFEYLAVGETLTLTYTLTLTDDHGASAQQTVTVTVNGTNDAPVISATSHLAGAVTESGHLADIDGAGPEGGLEPTIPTEAATDTLVSLLTDPDDVSTALTTVQDALEVDFATAIAIVWDYLDDIYVSAGPNQMNVNEAFVRLGVAYVEYLQAGGMPLTDVIAKYTSDGQDAGNDPDRVQSLHDNLLGNLSTAALTQRFGNTETFATLTNLVSGVDAGLLTRPYYSGNEGTSDNDVRDWDAENAYDAPTATGQLAASDVDNDAVLTWSISTPSEPVNTIQGTYGSFTIDASTGKWAYQLDDSLPATQALAAGGMATETFTATVTDEHGATDTVDVTITASGTNDAPVADASCFVDQTATTGQSFQFAVSNQAFADVDNGDTLTYSAKLIVDGMDTDLPNWLSFDPQTRTFSGTPPVGEARDYEIRVIAKDIAGATASESFTLTVEEGEGGNEPGTVTVNVESDEGLFTPAVYIDLLDADVLTVDELGRICLVAYGNPQNETGGADRYYRVSGLNLDTSTESGEFVLTGGTITQIELFSDQGFENRIANATGYNISATTLQAAIDKYDDASDASDYFALFEPYAYIMNGGGGTDILFGGSQNDTLNGAASSDMLAGMDGDDALDGGAGEDAINGGTGNDTLTGGSDLDVFVFSLGDGHDTITDFNTEASSPNQDWVTFTNYGDLSLEDLTFEAIEGDVTGTIVRISDDQSITFVGVDSQTLQQAAQSTFFFPNT